MHIDADALSELFGNRFANAAWAKTDTRNFDSGLWLSVSQHLCDSMLIADQVWDGFIARQTKTMLARQFESDNDDIIRMLYMFLCGVHDIGKLSPFFESQGQQVDISRLDDIGLHVGRFGGRKQSEHRHELTSYIAVRIWLHNHNVSDGLSDLLSVCVLGHHGKYVKRSECIKQLKYPPIDHKEMMGGNSWSDARSTIIDAAAEICGISDVFLQELDDSFIDDDRKQSFETVMTGAVIMSDWLSSDSWLMPLLSKGHVTSSKSISRAKSGYERSDVPDAWHICDQDDVDGMINKRFGISSSYDIYANAMQSACVDVADDASVPILMMIEAPMGNGKTEAALMVAEVLARKFGAGGVAFALPTMATANGIFNRMRNWCENVSLDYASISLIHSKSELNETYNSLVANVYDDESKMYVGDWFNGKKKILSNFVVCTIDQILMMATRTKHYMLRHLGLSGKIVIIDEIHSSDAFMDVYLERALSWLASMGCSIVLLSATISQDKRDKILRAYADGISADAVNIVGNDIENFTNSDEMLFYPLISVIYNDIDNPRAKFIGVSNNEAHDDTTVTVRFTSEASDTSIASLCDSLINDGGNIAIIRNTVRRAQDTYQEIVSSGRFNDCDITLMHSRFIATDRARKETELLDRYGSKATSENGRRPSRSIVVSTQVIEQSLDIDFDVMISDIAPIDLMLQRIGRLHRHNWRTMRPSKLNMPIVYVDGCSIDESSGLASFDSSIEMIYDRSLLIRTFYMLSHMSNGIKIPSDIPYLVQSCYLPSGISDVHGIRYIPESEEIRLKDSDKKHSVKIANKINKAESKVLQPPYDDLLGSADSVLYREEVMSSNVRDIDASLSVIMMRKSSDDCLEFIDGKLNEKWGTVPVDVPQDDVTYYYNVATQSVSLPYQLSNPGVIDSVITVLEETYIESFQHNRYTKGELILLLDEHNDRIIELEHDEKDMRFLLHYDYDVGLTCDKIY